MCVFLSAMLPLCRISIQCVMCCVLCVVVSISGPLRTFRFLPAFNAPAITMKVVVVMMMMMVVVIMIL